MSADYLRLKGVGSGVGVPLISKQILNNVLDFFTWGTLNAGGFMSVTLNEPGTYGGDKSRLRPVQDPRYTDGQVWEGYTNQWVWQSGITDFTKQPIAISGVWVNGAFYPNNTSGNYSFNINYKDGQVLFNSPIATNSLVQCEYSYSWIKFIDAEQPWFQQIMSKSDRIERPTYLTPGSGDWNVLSTMRTPTPVVGVKMAPRTYFTPMQLGGGHYVHKDINFYIVTENEETRNQIVDIITYQVDKTIVFYDVNNLLPPLNYNGTLASNPKTYADMVNATTAASNTYKRATFENMQASDIGQIEHNKLYVALVKCSLFVQGDEIV